MNDHPLYLPPPAESSAQRLLDDVKKFAREDPGQAAIAAFGVGLLINLLPTRALLSTAAVVGSTLLRPTLLTLGVVKGVELLCKDCSSKTSL